MPSQPQMFQGALIALEGLDGVGKTTQAYLLAQAIASLGLPVILTREPTEGRYGQEIRRLLRHGRQGLTPEEELALFLADRREHVATVILPALGEGAIVITDRYYFSSMAYQGALGLDPQEIQQRHEAFAPRPDLVIILDLPLDAIVRRLQLRGEPLSPSFENIAYLARVGEIFAQMAAPFIVRVHGGGSETEVQARILAAVRHVVPLPAPDGQQV